VEKLSQYINLGGFLTSNSNVELSFANKVYENDIIKLTLEGSDNGIYKVISLGSDTEPWVLEKLE